MLYKAIFKDTTSEIEKKNNQKTTGFKFWQVDQLTSPLAILKDTRSGNEIKDEYNMIPLQHVAPFTNMD